jgi:hypothetical protein
MAKDKINVHEYRNSIGWVGTGKYSGYWPIIHHINK